MNILKGMFRLSCAVACLLAGPAIAPADVFTFTGTLDPATNPNLTYWNQVADMYVPPIAGPDDADRAYNIAVHTFSVAVAGPVTFASLGYGLGGFDAVLSVFSGTGDSAVYLDHEFAPLFPDDFSFSLNLAAGPYTLAASVFGSQPCAPGLCVASTGTFGDGFNNLVNYDPFRTLLYNVEVTTTPVPEPASAGLLALSAAAILAHRRRRR